MKENFQQPDTDEKTNKKKVNNEARKSEGQADNTNLKKYRDIIDNLDSHIVDLLGKRFEAAQHIVQEKMKTNSPVYRPAREQEIFYKLMALNHNKVDNAVIQNIYREIMSATISMEKFLKISYLGPQGTYTHQAALKKFGHSLQLLPHKNIAGVFRSVSSGEAQYGVVPLENSIEGIVNSTLDLLLEYDLRIYAEVSLSIHHNLITSATLLDQIEELYTHTQANGQCRQWISNNMPNVSILETSSTGKAVELASQKKSPRYAAIGSQAAAEIYQMPVLVRSIEDVAKNFTRFVVIAKETESMPSRKDRTSVIFNVSHQPGSLFEAMRLFNEEGINLTSLISRPDRTDLWKYLFYVDFEGHIKDEKIQKLLEQLYSKTVFLRVLGSYPTDENI